MTAFYAVLHFLVDGLCALAMFGIFLPGGRGVYPMLFYNFCAFALQMPFGVLLDALNKREGGRKDFAFYTVAAGVACTVAGTLAGPAVLGIGNALFHVGGGVGTIREDHAGHWQGRGLGVFVAPGALGLYLGTLAAKQGLGKVGSAGVGTVMLLLCAAAGYVRRQGREETVRETEPGAENGKKAAGRAGTVRLAVCCLAVVILRSYVGMAVTFAWKNDITAGLLAVLAIVGGKAAGGFGAARFGALKTAAVSLGLAALCYFFSSVMPLGLGALFLFNMTMPVTLYWLACRMPEMPGFAFGLLTFALFLGFLPGYFQILPWLPGNVAGSLGCAVSLLLMVWGTYGSVGKSAGRVI